MGSKTTSKSRKKLIIVIIIIAAIVAAGLFGYSRLQAMIAQQGVTGINTAETYMLSRTNLESKVTASGNLESTDPVTVGSNVEMGEVETVYVEAGDLVYAGDVLAQMKTSDLERSISDTSSAITEAKDSDARSLAAAQRAFSEADRSLAARAPSGRRR